MSTRTTRGVRRAAPLAAALCLAVLAAACSAQEGGLRERIRERILERKLQKEQGQSGQPGEAPREDSDANARITKEGDYSFTIDHDGLKRAYRIHVPRGWQPGKPVPLLVALHGGGASMDYQARDENYGQISKSDKEGFVVAFPNGYSRAPGGKLATWNAGNCCGAARDQNVDDVGFIRRMVENLSRQLDIDRSKVFATGMSNGGLMAHRLACELPDMFRAIASVAGTDNTKSCNPSKPVSVMLIHAKNDDHMPFGGGMGPKSRGSQVTEFTSVAETVQRWVRRDGCAATPKRTLDKPGATCERYAGCRGDTAVALCVTDTGAHSWPGASKTRGEPASTAISANDVMWDFFMGR